MSWFRLSAVFAALVFVSGVASAYDVIANMAPTTGATNCLLFVDGVAAGTPKPCGSSQSYPGLIANPGTYAFAYRALNASGQSALSPVTTVTISVIPPPVDPTSPPTISVSCDPSPCPASITIVIEP